jgi:hypothetical protein
MKDDFDDWMNMDLDDLEEDLYEISIIEDANFNILDMDIDTGEDRSFFKEVINGGHGGHGYTGSEVHLEMAKIGSYHPKGKNEPDSNETKSIWIYSEGDHPTAHFHFYRGNDRKHGGCIKIKSSEYFPHDGHNDTLTTREIGELISFLNATDPDTGLNFWKVILASWNQQNSNFRVDMSTTMPDYSKL